MDHGTILGRGESVAVERNVPHSAVRGHAARNEEGTGYVGEERVRAEAAALTLGYQFELTGASLAATGLRDDTVELWDPGATFEAEGVTFTVVEPTGPAKRPPGSWPDKSRVAARTVFVLPP
jgi:hypothetical protein